MEHSQLPKFRALKHTSDNKRYPTQYFYNICIIYNLFIFSQEPLFYYFHATL
jgi:hypothetical protein